MSHDADLRSHESPNPVALDDGEAHVTHEQNTFHQQFHSVSSICTRSATLRSAVGGTTVSEARHVRRRIHPGLIQEATHEWAWTTSSSVEVQVTHVKNPMLNVLDAPSGAVFSAMATKGEDEHAVAVVAEALRFTGRARVILLSDHEKPTKKLADLVCDSRKHDTVHINTPVGSSESAGGIGRANQEIAKQRGH